MPRPKSLGATNSRWTAMESGRPKDGVLPASCPGGTSTRHQGGGLQTDRILADSIESFSLLVSMGISTFTSKECVIFCRVSFRLAMFWALNMLKWVQCWPPKSVRLMIVPIRWFYAVIQYWDVREPPTWHRILNRPSNMVS